MTLKNTDHRIDQLPDHIEKGQEIPKNIFTPIKVDRREFLKISALMGCALVCPLPKSSLAGAGNSFPKEYQKYIKEARYYEKLQYKKIRCTRLT